MNTSFLVFKQLVPPSVPIEQWLNECTSLTIRRNHVNYDEIHSEMNIWLSVEAHFCGKVPGRRCVEQFPSTMWLYYPDVITHYTDCLNMHHRKTAVLKSKSTVSLMFVVSCSFLSYKLWTSTVQFSSFPLNTKKNKFQTFVRLSPQTSRWPAWFSPLSLFVTLRCVSLPS